MKNSTDFNVIASVIDAECAGLGSEATDTVDPEQVFLMRQVRDILENYQDSADEIPPAFQDRVVRRFC
jgi:hypothetical protein